MAPDVERIKSVKERYEKTWLRMPDVVAVGIGITSAGSPGIIVSVKKNPQKARMKIPEVIGDIRIEIQVTGEIKSL